MSPPPGAVAGCARQPAERPAPTAALAGLTLVELLTALAVTAILTALAVPSMHRLLLHEHMVTQVNTLVAHLSLGRSEAVRRNRQVVLCRSSDGRACSGAGAWGDGWILFLDRDRDRARDGAEPILRAHGRLQHGLTLRYAAFPSGGYLTFRPTGITNANGTFTFCDGRGAAAARAVIVSKTGRARLSRRRPDGEPLTC